MKEIKDINVSLRKDGQISLNLDQGVKVLNLPIKQKDLLAVYAMFHTNEMGVSAIMDAMDRNKDLPWPMNKVKLNQHEVWNPISTFSQAVDALKYFRNQIEYILKEHEEGNKFVETVVI